MLANTAAAGAAGDGPVNAVVGDISWVEAHGALPGPAATEVDRIRTHLRYVVRELGAAQVPALSPAQRKRRRAALATLTRYAERGIFPRRRADDGFGARRPRFIDDRGVHCAVGHLIAASGAPELARAINEEYEYGYVREMRAPALVRWARDNGFTVVELATIQPSYSAVPTEASTRQLIARATDELTIQCARTNPPPPAISLTVRGDDYGRATVTTTDKDPFSRCFAGLASKLETGGGAYMGSPDEYRFQLRLTIAPAQTLLQRALSRLRLGGNNTGCLPRPGAVPRSAKVIARTDKAGLRVAVTTTPVNPEINACLERYLHNALHAFGPGSWQLQASTRSKLALTMSDGGLRQALRAYVPAIATDCYPAAAAPTKVRVSAIAKRDADSFVLHVAGASASFRRCVSERLQPQLRSAFSTPRRQSDGSYRRYFRIDASASASLQLVVETPAARERRRREQRRERERHRYDF